MSEQRWRIVDATGAVREVSVRAGHSALGGVGYFASLRDGDVAVFDSAPRDAVLRLALVRYLPAAEILAPGVLTRAEAVAAARREGAEAMRERCDDALTARLVEAVREVREATYRGSGAERDTAVAVRDVVDALRDALRALPLPGDATPDAKVTP